MTRPLWHIVQVSDVLDLELASALSESVDVIAWEPQRTFAPGGILPGDEEERLYSDPSSAGDHERSFRIRYLPLLRGFAKPLLAPFACTGPSVVRRLLEQSPDAKQTTLICTTPYFASVAELWPGPVVYWLTDLIAMYASANYAQVVRLDRRMCHAATLVCPNSARLASYLQHAGGCDPRKIQVVPNATRASNLLPEVPRGPAPLPPPLEHICTPVAGVIGNLAGNMDWLLLEKVVERTPWLSWVFVGPTSMHIPDRAARHAREELMSHPNAWFVGHQPYGMLAQYARCLDVAVLPYRRCEPTLSGSSTRFYEHLAACRPMIASRSVEEFSQKEPLLTLFENADEAVAALEKLREQNFDDGLRELRWHASRQGTWEARAATMQRALAERAPVNSALFPAGSRARSSTLASTGH